MFDIFAKLLSSVATFLFPVFASYKALQGHDSAELSPWLMYWVVLACVLLVESYTEWILAWFPFYQWIRAILLLYLVLPQTQGAVFLYQTHVQPFLSTHETEIDDFISSAHDRARAIGLQYLKNAIELIKQHVFGLQSKERPQSPPQQQHGGSYAQSLFARFNLPSMRDGPASAGGAASDFYALLSSAMGQATTTFPSSSATATEAQAASLSASGTLIPSSIRGRDARMSYISTQRERLGVLMRALDREASTLSTGPSSGTDTSPPGPLFAENEHGSALEKSRSEADFEKVERDEISAAAEGKTGHPATPQAGGWMPWNWSGSPKATQSNDQDPSAAKAKTTGADVAS
ncbi:MAG: biotin holocarboxylase synthetase [Chaenotheca gracillima]|nr:MAG: biotin holocarboxylase synthetase [Chaenotheca gracillima]